MVRWRTKENIMDSFDVQNALTNLRQINDDYDGEVDDELQDEINELLEQCKIFIEIHNKE